MHVIYNEDLGIVLYLRNNTIRQTVQNTRLRVLHSLPRWIILDGSVHGSAITLVTQAIHMGNRTNLSA